MRPSLRLGLPLLLAAACGDDGVHHLADAPVHIDGAPGVDAAPDAPPVPQPVELTITVGGAPAMGLPVYFQAPDGTSIATNMTDATGTASALMPNGGYVSVVDAFGTDDTGPGPGSAALVGAGEQHHVRTFAGAKPGDHLVLNDPGPDDGITMTVNMPDPVDPATTEYDFLTDCGGNEEDFSVDGGEGAGKGARRPLHHVSRLAGGNINLYGCGATANFLVLAIAEPNDYTTIGSFTADNVALADGGTIDFTAKTFTTAVTTTTVFSNIPAGYGDLVLSTDFAVPTGVYQSGDFSDTNDGVSLGSADTTATIVMARPSLTATRVDQAVLFGDANKQHLYRWGAITNGDGAYEFDLTPALAQFATAPALDLATDTASWTLAATGSAPNTVLVSVSQQRTFPDDQPATWTWDTVAPYAAASLAFPTLVGDAAEFNPVAATDTNETTHVILANVPGGYDVVRAHAFDLDPDAADLSRLAAGASGHFEIETSETQELPPPPPPSKRASTARAKAAAIAHPHAHRRAAAHSAKRH